MNPKMFDDLISFVVNVFLGIYSLFSYVDGLIVNSFYWVFRFERPSTWLGDLLFSVVGLLYYAAVVCFILVVIAKVSKWIRKGVKKIGKYNKQKKTN